jgi:tight adherence protein C
VNSDLQTRLLTFLVVSPFLISGIWVIAVETSTGAARRVTQQNGIFHRNSWISDLWLQSKARILISSFIFTTAFVFLISSQYLPLVFAFGIATILFSMYLSSAELRKQKVKSVEIEREFPSVIQIMAVLTSAGLSPVRAIQAIATSSSTLLAQEFLVVVADIQRGYSMVSALEAFALRVKTPTARRFSMTVAIALDRGSPIASTLIEQARDITLSSKNRLQREAGRREVMLMIPVVFLIMPISVLFALWPSMRNLMAIA